MLRLLSGPRVKVFEWAWARRCAVRERLPELFADCSERGPSLCCEKRTIKNIIEKRKPQACRYRRCTVQFKRTVGFVGGRCDAADVDVEPNLLQAIYKVIWLKF